MNSPLRYIVLSMAVCLWSCTAVEVSCPESAYGTQSRVTVTPDWSACSVDESRMPSKLVFAMQQAFGTDRQWHESGRDGLTLKDSVILTNGEWIIVALDPDVKGVTYSGFSEFRALDTAPLSGITCCLDTVSTEEVVSRRGMIDSNPGIPYYEEMPSLPLGYVRESVNGSMENGITVPMENVGTSVTFRLNIVEEGDVEVESVLAEVSGVPGSVSVMSRECLAASTGRVMFDMSRDTVSSGSSLWSGDVSLTGIVPPADRDAVTGEGVLCVRATVMCESHRMLVIASLNLKDFLEERPLLTLTSRDRTYRPASGGSFIFDITAVLRLSPEGVMPSGDASGVNGWVGQAKIDK